MSGKSRKGTPGKRTRPARGRPNPLARELADPRYAKRVVDVKKGVYRRRPRHTPPADG